MGLDISHDAWYGSYSSFGRWRQELARKAGIRLHEMIGFGGTKPFPAIETEPLVSILDHSDSDGSISWRECDKIAKRLLEIVKAFPDADEWFIDKTTQFAEGCDRAFADKEDLEFG